MAALTAELDAQADARHNQLARSMAARYTGGIATPDELRQVAGCVMIKARSVVYQWVFAGVCAAMGSLVGSTAALYARALYARFIGK
jgi:hypothetical protein